MLLKTGSQGIAVRAVQFWVNEADLSIGDLTVDGIFGDRTQKGVYVFQQATGLVPDGVAGPNTLRALTDLATARKAKLPLFQRTNIKAPLAPAPLNATLVNFVRSRSLLSSGGSATVTKAAFADGKTQPKPPSMVDVRGLLPPQEDGQAVVGVIFFDHGKASLGFTETSELSKMRAYKEIARKRPVKITLEAFADPSGSKAFNQALTKKRAQTIQNHLEVAVFSGQGQFAYDPLPRGELPQVGPSEKNPFQRMCLIYAEPIRKKKKEKQEGLEIRILRAVAAVTSENEQGGYTKGELLCILAKLLDGHLKGRNMKTHSDLDFGHFSMDANTGFRSNMLRGLPRGPMTEQEKKDWFVFWQGMLEGPAFDDGQSSEEMVTRLYDALDDLVRGMRHVYANSGGSKAHFNTAVVEVRAMIDDQRKNGRGLYHCMAHHVTDAAN